MWFLKDKYGAPRASGLPPRQESGSEERQGTCGWRAVSRPDSALPGRALCPATWVKILAFLAQERLPQAGLSLAPHISQSRIWGGMQILLQAIILSSGKALGTNLGDTRSERQDLSLRRCRHLERGWAKEGQTGVGVTLRGWPA